jgi:hypothetical protein
VASAHRYTWQRADGSTGRGWRAKWVDADGRTGSKRGFERQSDALAYAADREAEIRHGVTLSGERPTGRTTVAEWGRTWLDGLDLRPSSRDSYGYALARIEQTLGQRPLATLRPSELRSWQRALQDRYAPATARQTASMLAMLLRAAVADGLLERTPMPKGRGGKSAGRVVDRGAAGVGDVAQPAGPHRERPDPQRDRRADGDGGARTHLAGRDVADVRADLAGRSGPCAAGGGAAVA